MAASLIGWIWAQDLSSTAKLVLFALNEHTNIGEWGDWRVFPSHDRVAKMCGLSKRSVIRAMHELVESGVLTVAHQHDDHGRQLQNLYWLQAPKLMLEEGCQNVTPVGNCDTPEGDKLSHKPLYKNPSKKTKRKTPTKEDILAVGSDVGVWAEWVAYRLERAKPLQLGSWAKQAERLRSVPASTARQMVDQSIENGWQGLFSPKEENKLGATNYL